MPSTVVVGRGPRLVLVELGGPPSAPYQFDEAIPRAAERYVSAGSDDLPVGLCEAVRALPAQQSVSVEEARWGQKLAERAQRPIGVAPLADARAARAAVGPLDERSEREFLLAVARLRLEKALRAPDELLVTLAREEARVSRALEREERAAESLVAVPGSSLDELTASGEGARRSLAAHADRLAQLVEREARSVVPNLSAVVGPRVAARLVAAAGGLQGFERMRSSRLQLLGARRRPSPERGPRYGVLYLAARMDDVPAARRGAYARSLAALATIAARADATTRREVFPRLVARRDRRVAELSRRSAR